MAVTKEKQEELQAEGLELATMNTKELFKWVDEPKKKAFMKHSRWKAGFNNSNNMGYAPVNSLIMTHD